MGNNAYVETQLAKKLTQMSLKCLLHQTTFTCDLTNGKLLDVAGLCCTLIRRKQQKRWKATVQKPHNFPINIKLVY